MFNVQCSTYILLRRNINDSGTLELRLYCPQIIANDDDFRSVFQSMKKSCGIILYRRNMVYGRDTFLIYSFLLSVSIHCLHEGTASICTSHAICILWSTRNSSLTYEIAYPVTPFQVSVIEKYRRCTHWAQTRQLHLMLSLTLHRFD